ncbi:MAG: sensor histidine kinase [Chitinophagaceae bacterium]|nr:MAG: sensor histidine kinase [Chitinophagaceae bacterium]
MDSKETKIFTAILIAASVIGVIITYFITTVIRNQRRHLRLQQQFIVTEIATLEKERKRIVSDLHDELGPLLAVVKLQLVSIETNQQENVALINKATGNVDNILQRIRGICNELMPHVLIKKGLIPAIEEFVSDINDQSTVELVFRHNGQPVPKNAQIHIYRILQELINNALKHANASLIAISLSNSNGKMIIVVADNGVGFDAEKIDQASTGLGLKNIQSRTEVLKGDIYLDSQPGKGSTFTIEIPADKHGS